MSQEDWTALYYDLEQDFTPGTAIREQDLFAGRTDQLTDLAQCIRRAGTHAIIYGERGVGKSSLANVLRYYASSGPQDMLYVRVQAAANETFNDIWMKIFKRMVVVIDDQKIALSDKYDGKKISPDDILLEIEGIAAHQTPIIVIDEIDRISDSISKRLIADTIKTLSDEAANVTLVIVGVADAVGDLIHGHESIGRPLMQIEMPRMKDEEIVDIVTARIKKNGMRIDEAALWNIVFICKGLPFYAHLVGLHSAQAACERNTLMIKDEHVANGTNLAIEQSGQSIRDAYDRAVYSEKAGNIFKQVLVSCALADKDTLGRFTAKGVADRLCFITGQDYDVPAFSYHLKEFCSRSRGAILTRHGKQRQFRFRFKDALLEPFALINGINDGIITDDHIKKFRPKRQNDLFSI